MTSLSTESNFQKFLSTSKDGIKAALPAACMISPFVNGCNLLTVASAHHNLNTLQAIKEVYRGSIMDRSSPTSWWDLRRRYPIFNFGTGWPAHFAKEVFFRAPVKGLGLYGLRPLMNEFAKDKGATGQLIANTALSAALAGLEAVPHCLDTVRSVQQSGRTFRSTLPKDASFIARVQLSYAGVWASLAKKFKFVFVYTNVDEIFIKTLQKKTAIDPYSNEGVALRLSEALPVTSGIWISERLKNEVQNRPREISQCMKEAKVKLQNRSILPGEKTSLIEYCKAKLTAHSRYAAAFKIVCDSRTFTNGFGAKLASYLLILGYMNDLTAKGVRASKANA